MDDYQIALLFSVLVLVPLAGWKITDMVKRLQRMSSRRKEENEELTPKQKEFVEFLEKASNQSKEKNDAWCEIKFWFRWCRNEIQDHWNFSDFWLKRYCFYLVFLLFRSYLKRIMMEEWTSLITGHGFCCDYVSNLWRSSNHWRYCSESDCFWFVSWSNWILCFNGENGWDVRLEK